MDKKISELGSVTATLASDLIPIVSGGVNKKIAISALTDSLPSSKNSGVTANVPVNTTASAIPLTSTLVRLSLSNHTLGSGQSGQEITLIGSGTNSVTLTGAGTLTTVNFPAVG